MVVAGNLNVTWIHGSPSARRNTDPPIQVHSFDERTFILRQNKSVNWEAPFLYLFLGEEGALLVDTGATADARRFPLRQTVDEVIDRWLRAHPRTIYPLVVAHSHTHGDHVAADGQFADRQETIVVGHDAAAVRKFFGFRVWPSEVVAFDLGG